jgi:molybdate transport system permease protein
MLSALRLSLQILAGVLPLLFLAGTALGWILARKHFPGKRLVTFLLHLPLVLPPTVMGLYLRFLLGHTPLLRDMKLLFTLPAAMLAAFTAALPLVMTGARTGFAGVPQNLENAARSLGDGEWRVFFRISLPLARRPLFAGMALATARALGEFGITLMIAATCRDEPQTLPL